MEDTEYLNRFPELVVRWTKEEATGLVTACAVQFIEEVHGNNNEPTITRQLGDFWDRWHL